MDNIIQISNSNKDLFGVELLMNTDRKNSNKNKGNNDMDEIDFNDLTELENDLNSLVDNDSSSFKLNIDNDRYDSDDENKNVKFNEEPEVGKYTSSKLQDDAPSWDGFQKFNNNPINPDKAIPITPNLTKEELLKQKFEYLRKLEKLEKNGITLSKKYNMDSPLSEMQAEFLTIEEEKNKSNSIKFQSNVMMTIIQGVEFLNQKFDPFDVNLDGLTEQVTENITDYDDVFGELYEKYKSRGTLYPELRLLFQLGGSAMMVHMSNTMFKSSLPNMDDIMRQNPDLMRSFQTAAVQSMSEKSPGFSGFVNGIMGDMNRGPPAPIRTQEVEEPNYGSRGGNNSYGQFKQNNGGGGGSAGINSMGSRQPNFKEDNIKFQEKSSSQPAFQKSQRPQGSTPKQRQEMKGPSDISDVLSKLKTKTINIQQSAPPSPPQQSSSYNSSQFDKPQEFSMPDNNSSTVSFQDLQELGSGINLPKSSRKKNNSKNKTPLSSMNLDL